MVPQGLDTRVQVVMLNDAVGAMRDIIVGAIDFVTDWVLHEISADTKRAIGVADHFGRCDPGRIAGCWHQELVG